MLSEKVLKGVSWMAGGRVLGNILGLLSTIIVAKLLTPDDYGVFALGMSMVFLVSALVDLRTSLILIRLDDPEQRDFDTVFTINLMRGGLLCLIFCAIAWPASALFNEPRLIPLLLVLSLHPLLHSLANPYFDLHARSVSFLPTAILNLSVKIATFVGSVGFAILYASYWALVVGALASAVVSTLITFIMAEKAPGISLKSFRKVFSFSVWLALAGTVDQINTQSNRLILGAAFASSILGFFALGAQIVAQISETIRSPINTAIYSALSKHKDDMAQLQKSFLTSQRGMAAIMLPAAVGLIFVADPLIKTLFGQKWEGSIVFLQFTAAGQVMLGFVGPFWALAMARGATRVLFLRGVAVAVVALTSTLTGLTLYGLNGLLIGGLIGSFFNMQINLFIISRLLETRTLTFVLAPARYVLSVLVMALCLAGVTYMLQDQVSSLTLLFILVFVGGLSYGASVFAIWLIQRRPDGPEQILLAAAARRLPADSTLGVWVHRGIPKRPTQ